MKKLLCLCSFIVCICQQADAQSIPWSQSNGPYGGWVNCVAQDGSGRLWAGTQDGIFTSTDEGTHWQRLPALQLEHVVSIDFAASGTVIAAGDGGGIFYSRDNGSTWAAGSGISDPFQTDLIEAPNGHFYTVSDNVYRSTDAGATWQATAGSSNLFAYGICVDSSGTLYAATPSGFFYSTDEGTTWPEDTPGTVLADNYGLEADKSGNLYATTGAATWRSTDRGANWSQMSIGSSNESIYALSTKGGLFAASNDSFYRSTDGGVNWTSEPLAILSTTRCIYELANRHLLLGTFSGIERSTDTGTTWAFDPGTMTNTFIISMVAKASGDVFAVEGALLDPIYHSTDNGTTWTVSDLPKETATTQAFVALPDGSLLAGTSGNGVYRTTDNAATWVPFNTGLRDSFIMSLSYSPVFAPGGTAFLGTEHSGAFLLSAEGGNHWAPLPMPSSSDTTVTSTACDSSGSIVIATDAGIYIMNATSPQWTELQPLDAAYARNLAIDAKGDIVYSDFRKGVLLGSTAGGVWQNISIGLPDSSISSLVFDRDTLYATFYGHGIYRTTDLGVHWEAFDNGLNFPDVNSIAISPNGYMFAGTYGDGVYRSGSLRAGVAPTQVPQLSTSLYPNPTLDEVHVNFQDEVSGRATFRLYDELGNVRLSKDWNDCVMGSNERTLDVTNFSAGIYSYVITAGNGRTFGKLTILK